jgi:hypothetical protein
MREAMRTQQAVVEQLGTVDVYFHPTNPDPFLNCVTPHRGVAWIRREDLSHAFTGLERLGRIPRLMFQDALFPAAFQQQIEMMGLTLEDQRTVLAYRPCTARCCRKKRRWARARNLDPYDYSFRWRPPAGMAVWLRVFRADLQHRTAGR